MSEQILKALLELFAIIARPESNRKDRKTVVEYFLRRQLNQELVSDYLSVFDRIYEKHEILHRERGKKRIGPDSVKVLKICDQINKELTHSYSIPQLRTYINRLEQPTVNSVLAIASAG